MYPQNKFITIQPNLTKQFNNLIFLDLDGVLNSEDHGRRCCEGKASHIEKKYNLCQTLCNTFNNMSFFGGDIAVVISSTRRWDYSIHGWNSIFEKFGIYLPVIGKTHNCQSGIRGAEINMWLSDHCEKVTGVLSYQFKNYIIFDDDSDMLIEQIPNFVQTNGYMGIHYNDTHKACAYLANDPFYFQKDK